MNEIIKESIQGDVQRLMRIFPNSFINYHFELIVEPKNNIYFLLGNVGTKEDLQFKVLAWMSRPSCKGVSDYWQRIIRNGLNEFLGTEFSVSEMMLIYTYLGNAINETLCREFIRSGFDVELLKAKEAENE